MKDIGSRLTIGACGEPCPRPPDEIKLSIDMSQVAAELASLTHCRYRLADQAFKKFRIIHGLHLIWQAHCSHRLMLRFFKESKSVMDKSEKEMKKELGSLLKETEAKLAQPTSAGDSSTRPDAGNSPATLKPEMMIKKPIQIAVVTVLALCGAFLLGYGRIYGSAPLTVTDHKASNQKEMSAKITEADLFIDAQCLQIMTVTHRFSLLWMSIGAVIGGGIGWGGLILIGHVINRKKTKVPTV